MDSILIFLCASYVMLAFSYTLEATINKDVCIKYWYLVPLVIIWCVVISWFYFPNDLGAKLYKKLNESKNT
jgi:hypothetical protein